MDGFCMVEVYIPRNGGGRAIYLLEAGSPTTPTSATNQLDKQKEAERKSKLLFSAANPGSGEVSRPEQKTQI